MIRWLAARPAVPRPTVRPAVPAALALAVAALAACGGDGAGAGGGAAPDPAEGVAALDSADLRAHLATLSADSFAGRAPGTAGGEMAAEYIAGQFREMGLEPVEGSYFQTVPMVGSTPLAETASLALGSRRLDYLEDFVVWAGAPEAESASASGELVFVGYGIEAPEADWSDYGGQDMSGKVALILVNDPPAPDDEPELFGGPAMTYYGRWTYKYEEAARQGAEAAIIVHTTEEAGYGWNVVRGSWSGEQFALPPDPSGPEPLAVEGWITREVAEGVLESAGLDLSDLMERASSRDFTPVATGVSVSAAVESEIRTVETRNVVGRLPGSERPDEVVTITSHYDHLGVGEAVDGDSIFNGAYDNASGVAMMLEVADAFTALETAPARSVLFIATAAEEQGLLGAEWYVQSPLVPLERTVAEINVDGANLWGETDDVIAMGAERSGLGEFVERRATEMGLRLAPDAEPEKGFFFRSDHFPFARAGVPSLYIEHGVEYRGRPEGWGLDMKADYTANRYHAPGDEFSEDFVYDGAVQQARLVFLTAFDVASGDAWPNWNEGSEFRAARDEMMAER